MFDYINTLILSSCYNNFSSSLNISQFGINFDFSIPVFIGNSIQNSIGQNKVEVTTNVPGYTSGTYDIKKAKSKNLNPVLGDLLLSSIGIENTQLIYKNKYYDTQKMSWRTILTLMLYSVNDIVKEDSVIEPTQATEKTAFLSSFLLLIYGKEINQVDPKAKREIRVASKKAVEEYVNKKISSAAEKKKALEEQLALFDGIDVEQKMQEIIDRIKETEAEISNASSQIREILNQIV